MHGDSEYNIMFGPDICGYSTKKVHVIFRYNGENHLIKKDIKCKDDELTHIYTLVVTPDNKYKVCRERNNGGMGEGLLLAGRWMKFKTFEPAGQFMITKVYFIQARVFRQEWFPLPAPLGGRRSFHSFLNQKHFCEHPTPK